MRNDISTDINLQTQLSRKTVIMKRSIKSEIKILVDDIEHHLKEVDNRLDKIWLLLDSIEEASEVDPNKIDSLVHEFKEGRREVVEFAGGPSYGSCPLCGNPLSVLSRAPLVVECSNARCSNRFRPK